MHMQTPTYESLSSIIADVKNNGRSVQVRFVCPVSQKQVQARYTMPTNNSMGARAQQTAQRSFMYAAQNAVSQVLRNVFGYNLFGRVASDVARQTMHTAASNSSRSLSAAEQKEAVVQAFLTVSSQFAWDGKRSSWISASALKDALSPFDLQLQEHPITHQYDRMILARMLVQMAMADGVMAPEESQFLEDFIDPNLGSVQSLSARPPLSSAEFSQVSSGGVRESMLMLTWTLSIADEDFDPKEAQLLQKFAQQLNLNQNSIQKARTNAQDFILSQAMETMFAWGGQDQYARQKLLELAGKIGVSQQEALMAEARFQRRRG